MCTSFHTFYLYIELDSNSFFKYIGSGGVLFYVS